MPRSRLRSILPSRTRRSSRARVLRSSAASISRETAVQDSHALGGIFAKIAASILRALMRRGSLQARSVNWRGGGVKEVRIFRVITFTNRRAFDGESRVLMRPQHHCGLAPRWRRFDPRDSDSEHGRLPATAAARSNFTSSLVLTCPSPPTLKSFPTIPRRSCGPPPS
jgi:hypothetical protein